MPKGIHKKRYSMHKEISPRTLLENASLGQEVITKKLKLKIKNNSISSRESFFGRIKDANRAKMERLQGSLQRAKNTNLDGTGKLKIKVNNSRMFNYEQKLS